MADDKQTKIVQSSFSLFGLTISKKLASTLAKKLVTLDADNIESWVNKIIDHILTQNLTSPNVSIEHIQIALNECLKPESALKDTETVLNVISAFEVPKIKYDLSKQKFVLSKSSSEMFPDAPYKSLVFKERLDLLWYKTLKHFKNAESKFSKARDNKLKLVPIEFLLSESKTKNVCIMGLLSQIVEGQYYLEDYAGAVKINLKNAVFSSSLIMEGNIVIAKGIYTDGVLQVENIDFPPVESSASSRALFSDANTFGGPHPTSLKMSEKLKLHEEANENDYMIFISDFWVDSQAVLSKFKILLAGYAEGPPVAFVLCGHFLSTPTNTESVKKMKEGFKKVAEIILEFPLVVQNSKFIFVPGPFDFSAPKILPRAPVPKYLLEDFIKLIPDTYLATNPCRIQYCTKEIVVFRENMLSKFSRNTLHYPKLTIDENGDIEGEHVHEAFTKAIIRQAHLCPLLFSVLPVFWQHDQALQLYPIPDLVVVADEFRPFNSSYSDCLVSNPGSFVKTNFNFMCYTPALNAMDTCCIPSEDL